MIQKHSEFKGNTQFVQKVTHLPETSFVYKMPITLQHALKLKTHNFDVM